MLAVVDTNLLYYGDNLDILRRYIPDESIDLVYLDPPFNSNRDYNVIFKDESGRKSDAQLLAFEDTWHWGPDAEAQYAFLTETARHQGRVPGNVSTIIAALRAGIGENQMLAYLVEMAVRLVELRRVLKPTGSMYLHCDPTASHYLKLLLDAILGPVNFRNEIIWERTTGRKGVGQFGRVHDTILFYSRGQHWTWNSPEVPQSAADARGHDLVEMDGERWRISDLTGAGQGPARQFGERGEISPPTGRHWQFDQPGIDRLLAEGRIVFSRGGKPRLRTAITGASVRDIWTDIEPVNAAARERLGYPTQKPLALLERIIGASSNPGDIVLDPFCGCGTAVVAAETLGRKWIGIDITYLSIAVMRARLKDAFRLTDVPVVGQPTEVEGARQLAQGPNGRYQFQWWALNLIDAQPVGGVEKKGADRGIDGRITFTDDVPGRLEQAIVSVKSGHVNSSMVRDLKGTIEREKAAIGLFITLEEPTKEMRLEASTAGFYHSVTWDRDYPRLQLLSIRELLDGTKRAELPPSKASPYQKAERVRQRAEKPRLL